MDQLSIKNDLSYDEIEDAFRRIKDNQNLDLIIPLNIKSKQLGIISEIIQLIITWSVNCNGSLYINFDSNTENLSDKVDLMFSRYWNFIAACMSYDKGIYTRDKVDIKPIVAKTLAKKLKELSAHTSWKKGTNEFIPSVKHSASPLPFAFYYPKNKTLRSKQEFIELTDKLLISVAKNYKSNTDISSLKLNKTLIGNIIFELIENTHKWSLRDALDEEYFKAVRGLYIASHHGPKSLLLDKCKDDKALYDYINDKSFIKEELQFIEISVFDSGPGLASRWLGLPNYKLTTYDQIYDAIINCLVINNTTSKTNNYERGYGFYNILKVLKDRGFFKIKTNGIKLYRNFIQHPFKDDSEINDYQLFDWNHNQNNSKEVNLYQGTLCSIIFPLNS